MTNLQIERLCSSPLAWREMQIYLRGIWAGPKTTWQNCLCRDQFGSNPGIIRISEQGRDGRESWETRIGLGTKNRIWLERFWTELLTKDQVGRKTPQQIDHGKLNTETNTCLSSLTVLHQVRPHPPIPLPGMEENDLPLTVITFPPLSRRMEAGNRNYVNLGGRGERLHIPFPTHPSFWSVRLVSQETAPKRKKR